MTRALKQFKRPLSVFYCQHFYHIVVDAQNILNHNLLSCALEKQALKCLPVEGSTQENCKMTIFRGLCPRKKCGTEIWRKKYSCPEIWKKFLAHLNKGCPPDYIMDCPLIFLNFFFHPECLVESWLPTIILSVLCGTCLHIREGRPSNASTHTHTHTHIFIYKSYHPESAPGITVPRVSENALSQFIIL